MRSSPYETVKNKYEVSLEVLWNNIAYACLWSTRWCDKLGAFVMLKFELASVAHYSSCVLSHSVAKQDLSHLQHLLKPNKENPKIEQYGICLKKLIFIANVLYSKVDQILNKTFFYGLNYSYLMTNDMINFMYM